MPSNVLEYKRIEGTALLMGRAREFQLELGGIKHLVIEVDDFADAQRIMDALRTGVVTHRPEPPAGKQPDAPVIAVARAPTVESPRVPASQEYNGLNCAVCGERQVLTSSGVTCPKGHGGAEGVAPDPKPAAPAPTLQVVPAPAAEPKPAPKPPSGKLTLEDLPDEVKRATGINQLTKWLWEARGVRTVDEAVALIGELELGCVRRAGDQLRAKIKAAIDVLTVTTQQPAPTA